MEAIGSIASITALIELSASVLKYCVRYLHAVKNASADIARLQNEVIDLKSALQRMKDYVDGPNGPRLQSASNILDALNTCSTQLSILNNKLSARKSYRLMDRLGLQSLAWSFDSKEVNQVITDLERSKSTLLLSLQLDQTLVTSPCDSKSSC